MANQYVIRFKNGKSSEPLSFEAVKERIMRGELRANESISVHPNEFAMVVKDYPEFEEFFKDDEKTIIYDKNKAADSVHEDKTRLFEQSTSQFPVEVQGGAPAPIEPLSDFENVPSSQTKKQETMMFERPKALLSKDELKKTGRKLPKKSFLILIMLFLVIYEMYDEDEKPVQPPVVMTVVRPQLPSGGAGTVDPEKSTKIYEEGIKPYLEDTVQGYRRAVDRFQFALTLDPQNVRALAMLASSYLNLIDSSNKDENTFSVINKLIELSRVKDLNLVETEIAEVEFLAASRRYDAAIQRLTEFAKVSGKFDPVLFYYLGWLHSLKGDGNGAMKALNLIPSSALPMPRLFYLRGFLHEENKEWDEAQAEYKRALRLNPKHAKSILGLVRVAEKKGELKSVLRMVEFLTTNPSYQSPNEYVSALIYRSKLAQLYQQPEEAVKSLQRALNIQPKNETLRLEYYTLLAQSVKDPKYKNLAQMYSLMLEGDRDQQQGKTHEAITVFLQAKDAFPKSELPLEKMGDLFARTGEYQKAQSNYKKALELNPKATEIVVKLIDALIRNQEWEDAQKYLAKYRNHPALKSSIDRLAGDLAFHQKSYDQAIGFYRKAMARDSIDTEVYSSYATALREMDQCKDAQFFYSLAQRLDPFSLNAILGSAKCLLKTDNVDTAVGRIQEELARFTKAKADLLAGIGEVYYLAHEDEKALQFVEQAKAVDVDYPESYRIEGLVYLRQTLTKKDIQKKALEALKAYSDRKPSDPFGYIQRFEVFLKDSNFEQAAEELNKVFEVSPRFTELHYRRAQLYSKMARTKDALGELQEELRLNPRLTKAWVEQGNILLRANNLDEAMKSFVKAMEIEPTNAEAKIGAGWVNYQKRQFPSAIALLNAALSLDRGNPDIYKKLGAAYRDSGDQQKAAQAFRSYLDLAPDAQDRGQYEQYR